MAEEMDAYAVLNLPKRALSLGSLRVEQVRTNYKLLAMQLHPDRRPQGISQLQATQMFQVLTNAYREVLSDIEMRKVDRTFDDLRGESRSVSMGSSTGSVAPLGTGKEFDFARFNRVFNEVRVRDPVMDGGYGDWMQRIQSQADVEAAEQERNRKHMQLQKYREPEAMGTFAKKQTAFTELGSATVVDYGGRIERGRVDYCDYRLAHTTTRLADPKALKDAEARAQGDLRSVEALKAERANVPYDMSEQDLRIYNRRQRELQKQEERRLSQLSSYDREIGRAHDVATRLLLK
jgi:curved DNA-binding protein CbpA